ncbi:MAG: hypothetical protein EXS36_11860 [Pedosphaera sp.]|nr:hypothetical protein [Pedosphaera sp.]
MGAVLYHLLTGRPPFVADTVQETFEAVLHTDSPPPRLLNASVNPDLETICLKCHAKQPVQRYRNAEEMALDLQRWSQGRPIHARRVGLLEKAIQWAYRNRLITGAISAIVVSVVAGGIAFTPQWLATEHQRKRAEASNRDLDGLVAKFRINQAQQSLKERRPTDGLAQLALAVRANPSNQVAVSRLVSTITFRNFGIPTVPSMDDGSDIASATFGSKGTRIVTWFKGTAARVWNVLNGVPVTHPLIHTNPVKSASISRDGRYLLTMAHERFARVWDARTGDLVAYLPIESANIATFTPNGLWMIVGGTNGNIRVFDAERFELVHELREHSGKFGASCLARTNPPLLTGSMGGTVRSWNLTTGQLSGLSLRHPAGITYVEMSSDGSTILTSCYDLKARVWDRGTGKLRFAWLDVDFNPVAIYFSIYGSRFVTGNERGILTIWGTPNGNVITHYTLQAQGQFGEIYAVNSNPDGRSIISSGQDGSVHIWDLGTATPLIEPFRLPSWVSAAEFSPDR